MRSLSFLVTSAAFGLAAASQSWTDSDVTVQVTATRTHTVCPLTTALTCKSPSSHGVSPTSTVVGDAGANWASQWDHEKSKYTGQWDDWNTQSTSAAVSTSTTSGVSGVGSTTTWGSGSITTTTTSPSGYGSNSTTTGIWGNGTVTTSAYGSSTTVTSSSLSSSLLSSTTSTSGCPATSTPVANSTDVCGNSAADRSKWCNGKNINTDVYDTDYRTHQKVSYVFTITNTTINYDGTGPKVALAINGQVPGPAIEANWGDEVEVTIINRLSDNATAIHFHGIRQYGTNDQDGVPGITECGIAGNGGQRTYTWIASSYGTSWYHSHMFAQFGDGIRGPIVIHGPATANYDYDMGTLMVDDTFVNTAAAQADLIAHTGPGGAFNTLFNGKNKGPSGATGESFQWSVKSCKKHLFRIINSSSQNSYIIGFDKHTMTVIAADFVPIKPYKTDTLKIANGQRYDVIVEMNQTPGSYFVRAVIQTACPSGGANSGLGIANAIITYEGSSTPPVTQTSITNVTAAICQDEPLASLVPWVTKPCGTSDAFASTASTVPAGAVTQVATSDDGTVFNWYINNSPINVNYSQPTLQTLASGGPSSLISNPIILNQANKFVYFIIQNQFFVSHPMHIHGHDVAILGTGNTPYVPGVPLNFENPMRRDTIMLQGSAGPTVPAGYTVIGFETDNPGAWLMHCHIAWHVDEGLALQFIERPDDIPAKQYTGSSFQEECSALAAYEASTPIAVKSSGESGLKKRTPYQMPAFGDHASSRAHRHKRASHGHAH